MIERQVEPREVDHLPIADNDTVKKRCFEHMRSQRLTFEQVAERLGRPVRAVREMISGHAHCPTIRQQAQLAAVFGVTREELWDMEPRRIPPPAPSLKPGPLPRRASKQRWLDAAIDRAMTPALERLGLEECK